MSAQRPDLRLLEPTWDAGPPSGPRRLAVRTLLLLGLPLAAWYFGWLLQPERMGHPVLFALLVAAEMFNLVQALGFWWTARPATRPRPGRAPGPRARRWTC